MSLYYSRLCAQLEAKSAERSQRLMGRDDRGRTILESATNHVRSFDHGSVTVSHRWNSYPYVSGHHSLPPPPDLASLEAGYGSLNPLTCYTIIKYSYKTILVSSQWHQLRHYRLMWRSHGKLVLPYWFSCVQTGSCINLTTTPILRQRIAFIYIK